MKTLKENQQVLNDILQTGVSLLKISKETNIPVDRMYKWKAGNGLPKSEDTELLKKWLSKFRKVPYSAAKEVVSEGAAIDAREQIILQLVESNRKLVDNTVDLTQMAKANWSTTRADESTQSAENSMLASVLRLLARAISRDRFRSEEEAFDYLVETMIEETEAEQRDLHKMAVVKKKEEVGS